MAHHPPALRHVPDRCRRRQRGPFLFGDAGEGHPPNDRPEVQALVPEINRLLKLLRIKRPVLGMTCAASSAREAGDRKRASQRWAQRRLIRLSATSSAAHLSQTGIGLSAEQPGETEHLVTRPGRCRTSCEQKKAQALSAGTSATEPAHSARLGRLCRQAPLHK